MSVGEICNREVIITDKNTSIREAARLMREYHVGDLIVVEKHGKQNAPVGIVTDRDIVIEVLAQDVDLEQVTVSDLMAGELATLYEEADFWDALSEMRRHGVRRMPVINQQGGLEGILTIDDALELLTEGLDEMVKLIRNEMQTEMQHRK